MDLVFGIEKDALVDSAITLMADPHEAILNGGVTGFVARSILESGEDSIDEWRQCSELFLLNSEEHATFMEKYRNHAYVSGYGSGVPIVLVARRLGHIEEFLMYSDNERDISIGVHSREYATEEMQILRVMIGIARIVVVDNLEQ